MLNRTLFADFGGLLEKHLFLRRTLLLWLPNVCCCRNAGSKASKRYVGAAFGARGCLRTFSVISVAY